MLLAISSQLQAQCTTTPVKEAVRNGNFEAGYLGGPVFKEVISYALKSYQIAPTGNLHEAFPLDAATLKKREKITAAAVARD